MENFEMQVAEIELSYHPTVKPSLLPDVYSANDAYEIFMKSWDKGKLEFVEQSKVILLSQCNKALGIVEISTGGIACTYVDIRVIFAAALKANAVKIMLCHNHPSGNLSPSQADQHLTFRIREAGKILGIEISDHLIISAEGYYSFSDEGGI